MKSVNARKLVGLVAVIVIIVSVVVVIENPFAQSPVQGVSRSGESSLTGPPVGVEVGQRAPDFTLETHGGEKVSLSDFRGKVVVVNFWATWCPFCVAEMPDLERVSQEFDGKVVVLGINRAETIDKQRDFLNDLEIEVTYLLLQDPSDSLATAYGVRIMPTSFF
ncbi:MAG: TlpA family protein disulfide reductase, partial [Candidatus Bathyarchaeia archaeon]